MQLRSRRDRSRPLERALVLAAIAALLSRGRSLLPRTPQDQSLITAAAGLAGGAVGLAAEGATAVLAKRVGGRGRATGLLAGLGLAGVAWARGRRGAADGPVGTPAQVLLASTVAGEAAVAAYGRIPREQRARLRDKVLTTALAAGSAMLALRRKLAEPRDVVKASILYDFLPTVSGGEGSLLPLERLDREGRKFLGNAVPADRISELMGEEARDPIRVYAGLGSAESPDERARLAVAELQRLGAFERPRIVYFCPAGSGLVNPVAAEAEELLSRGDVASVAVQYSNKRAVRAFKDLGVARQTWRTFLEQLGRALEARPAEERPEIAVYGESLGAWVIADVLAEGGAATVGALRIARGALIGVPYQAREKLRAIRASGEPLPEGVGIFGSVEDVTTRPGDEQALVRYALVTHPEDPVGLFSGARLLWERPDWLARDGRHTRIPSAMRWLPGITYLQVVFDVKNATGSGPVFQNYGHDYRVELPALLRVAFGHLGVSNRQLHAIEEETVRSAERQGRREQRARVGPSAPR